MESLRQMERESGGLAKRSAGPDEENETIFHVELEKLDEEAMAAELAGTTVFEDLFYETRDHKAALTWTGVKELRNIMRQQRRPISVVSVDVVEVHYHDYAQYGKPAIADFPCTKYCKYIGKAVSELVHELSPAEAEQTVLMEVYDRDKQGKRLEATHLELDPFARSKVVSKAKRNAIKDFIPELAVTKAYEKWKALKSAPPQQKTKAVGHGEAKPETKENQPGPGLFPLPGYERKTKLVEIADDHVDDMRRAVANIAWYYSSSGDYKNNTSFKAGNPWGWARKDSQGAEGIVAALDEEGPDSKIIFDDEEFWFDESADKLWRRKV